MIDPETGICRDINTVNNFCGAYNPIKDIWVDIIPIASSYIDYWRTPPTTLDYGPFDFIGMEQVRFMLQVVYGLLQIITLHLIPL